jgi:hypothetical protein
LSLSTPRRSRRVLAGVAVLATTFMAVGPAAYADTVANNVTVGGNDTTTVGSTTTVSYSLTATNDPSLNEGKDVVCNASASSPVEITVKVAVPDGTTATINPAKLSFTDCSTAKSVKLGANKVGEYKVSVTTGATKVETKDAGFTLKVKPDTTGPVLTLPADVTVEATSKDGAKFSYTATAYDAGDDASTTVACSPISGSTFPIAATTVNCSSKDSKGNESTGSFKVTVVDTTGPVLTLTDTTVEATGGDGATVAYTATANDAVEGVKAVSCTPASGTKFALGTTTVSCSSSDSKTNKSSGTLKVTVQDKTAPALTLPDTTVEATSSTGATVSYSASATDIVDGAVTPSCDKASGTEFALGKTTVNCSATDKAGNKATGSFTVTVGDTTAPTLKLTDTTAEATAPDGADVKFSATATDVVDGAVTPQCTPGSGSTFALGETTVNCSATDSRGNTTMGTLKVTVQDKTPPSLTLSDETNEATGPDGAKVNYTASASDLVSGTVAVSCDKDSGSVFALGTTTVNCSATDKAGNTAKGLFTVSVKDRTAPLLVLANQKEEATAGTGAVVKYDTKATDLVDGAVAVSCDKPSGSTFPLGSTTVTCSAADKAGNKATDTLIVTVVDTTAPAIAVASKTIEATGPDGAKGSYTATANDLVDGTVDVSCDVASGSLFPLGSTTVTCEARDSRNNFDKKSFTISVVDTTAPEVTTTDKTAEATGSDGAKVEFAASAIDLVDGKLPVSCTPASGSTFALGTTTVSCTSTDTRGNKGEATAKITVRDTTGPALTLADQTIEATGPDGAAATFTPTAKDLVSGDRAVTCDKDSGSTFPIAATTVSCSAADAAGNKTNGTFTITVGDKTAPSLTLTDAQAEATKPAGADVTYSASAKDLVDGARPIDCSPASGSTFPIAITKVGCTASDTRGNTAQGSLNVTVTDSTPPSLTLTDQKAEASSASGATVTYPASASDIVDGAREVSCDKVSGSTFPIGTTTVNCSATDTRANKGTGSFTVTVKDTTAPTLKLAGKTAEATGSDGAKVEYSASASDTVDGAITPACDKASGSTFALGTTTVTCSATDKAGNKASGSLDVTVQDTTAPVLSFKDGTAEATSSTGAAVNYTATAKDVVDGDRPVTCTPTSGSTFKIGDTAVACSAADKAGNKAEGGFTVTVQDTTAPVLAKPADIALTATSAAGAVATYSPAGTDAVDGSVAAACTPASGSTFALGTTLVSCTATDSKGNTSAAQGFAVTVTVPWSNVLQPINVDGTSVFKLGSTVPVKFKLSGSASAVTNLSAKLYYAKISNGLVGTELEASSTAAADSGNTFRYDATAGQYIFNLTTKGWSEGTYQLRVDLGDGVKHTVNITSRK